MRSDPTTIMTFGLSQMRDLEEELSSFEGGDPIGLCDTDNLDPACQLSRAWWTMRKSSLENDEIGPSCFICNPGIEIF